MRSTNTSLTRCWAMFFVTLAVGSMLVRAVQADEPVPAKPQRIYRSLLPTTCVDDLINNEFRHGKQVHVNAKALAVGIDLSDLGYAPGEALSRLDLLETLDHHYIDPVLIVGLPSFITRPLPVSTHSR